MPIHFACEFEDQAKQECLNMRGQYLGHSPRYSGRYTWQTYAGACITSFVGLTATGIDRFIVVYDKDAESFEAIAISGDAPSVNPFVTGGDLDAPADLREKYGCYQYLREEARLKAKNLFLEKGKSLSEARLRKIKGKTIEIIAGTTIKHGTMGRVFWAGFGEKGEPRVGFTDDGGVRRWASLKNVREAQYLPLLEWAS